MDYSVIIICGISIIVLLILIRIIVQKRRTGEIQEAVRISSHTILTTCNSENPSEEELARRAIEITELQLKSAINTGVPELFKFSLAVFLCLPDTIIKNGKKIQILHHFTLLGYEGGMLSKEEADKMRVLSN